MQNYSKLWFFHESYSIFFYFLISIESNAGRIESNAGRIKSNAGRIKSNASRIESNAGSIESNAGSRTSKINPFSFFFSGFTEIFQKNANTYLNLHNKLLYKILS